MIDLNICVSWSGGKNSTYAAYLYDKYGLKVTLCCYIPMFDDTIPLISKDVYDFILKTADFFRSKGHNVVFVKGITYVDWCMSILKKGKNKGLPRSFPLFIKGKCGFASDSKIKSIHDFFTHNKFDFIDIGLCSDEFDRHSLLKNEVSILQSLELSDMDCFISCRYLNLLSPKYEKSFRDGCVLCPHAKSFNRVQFFNDYPQAKEKVLELQRIAKLRGFYPLRNKRWFIENEEFIGGYGSNISIFGEVIN